MKKICFVVAAPATANAFLRDQIEALSGNYEIVLVANIKDVNEVANLKLFSCKSIEIHRGISLNKDLKAVYQLYKFFKRSKFDIVHSVTPKAGLVTALAGFLTGTPHRIHIFTGQVWVTRKGPMRWMLMMIDRLIALLDNHILVDGESQRQFLVKNHIISSKHSQVLGSGSICGVNMERFMPNADIRVKWRKNFNIGDEKVVFVFMGRLNRDKGLFELLSAFDKLAMQNKKVFLLLFGNDEENIASTFSSYKNLKKGDNFCYAGRTSIPQKMLQAGDIFVLPTYREGFGSSVIEAACLGLPTITSDVYGVLDASVAGETGLQCKVRDVESLYEAMTLLADNADMRITMGGKGRKRVLQEFAGETVVQAWADYYKDLLG